MKFWYTVFGYRTLPTTALLILVYATVFGTVFVTDELPDVPENRGGIDFDQANTDLHQVCLDQRSF
jgi:hypothetical protein